jgi:putative ABC transport system ATP-binding protein
MARLVIKDLTIEYSQAGYVVRPVDRLSVVAEDGELVILLGPSGSGKTTLLSCIAGILSPAAGTILAGDTEVTALRGAEMGAFRRYGVGIVFQAFNLVASLTARENVEAPMLLAGASRRVSRERAEELLRLVGLDDRMTHRPNQLSGGQQQRVAIARALVHEPPLIVADEPTAHLDYVQVEGVLTLLRRLAAPGRLVVVATHDDRFAPLADRVIELVPERASAPAQPVEVELAAGQVLFEQGDPSDLVYIITAGEVEIFRRTPDGGDDVLAHAGPGDYFGELGPLLRLPRSASARAVTASALTGYPLRDFRRWQAARTGPTVS